MTLKDTVSKQRKCFKSPCWLLLCTLSPLVPVSWAGFVVYFLDVDIFFSWKPLSIGIHNFQEKLLYKRWCFRLSHVLFPLGSKCLKYGGFFWAMQNSQETHNSLYFPTSVRTKEGKTEQCAWTHQLWRKSSAATECLTCQYSQVHIKADLWIHRGGTAPYICPFQARLPV